MVNPLKSIFDSNEKQLKKAQKIVEQVNALEPEFEKLSYAQMRERLDAIRAELAELSKAVPEESRLSLKRIEREKGLPEYEVAIQQKLWEVMPEVFAFIREAYKRETGKRHYDVQILAGAILAQGQKLTELKTGEGKTMTFNLPTFLYALVGRGTHLVTVNEYLVKRDAEYTGHVAEKLGITVGVVAPGGGSYKYIDNEMVKTLKGEDAYKEALQQGKPELSGMHGLNLAECTKRDAYNCDITVSVNSELGFDYLRDNMAWEVEKLVQRELYYCIVDEADSILIDEARTPLIISATPSQSDVEKYATFARVVKDLEEDKHYEIDYKARSALLTEDGIKEVEKIMGVENLWADYSSVHHLENALKAKALFLRDDHYLVRNGEVLIVDSFTGRVMEGRRYSEGLHQAIEAKEGVEVQQESKTFATITFQNFFRLYKVLCGGSGTIMTEGEEFFRIYSLESVAIPTNKPVIREDKNDLIFANQDVKFRALVKEVQEHHQTGRPILIGTASIEKSEIVSGLLDDAGIPHAVLNAKYHEQEARIVSKAGEKGAVTVATNMAGRGTDIPLGEGVVELGGLVVLGGERHEARRIDNQLRGRSGRQGDPGYTRFFVALDDTIMKVMGGDFVAKFAGRIMDEDMPIELGLITRQIEAAQKRVESLNFDSRKSLVEYDDVMNQHREVFYARRRRLMLITEKSLGKLWGENSKNANIAEVQGEAVVELKEMIREAVMRELENTVAIEFNGNKELAETESVNLVNQILDFGPDDLLAKSFGVKQSDFSKHILESVHEKTEPEVVEFLQQGITGALDEKINTFGDKEIPVVAKVLILETMDNQWMQHLETMTDIRSGIGLQGYAQRDPLVEYKNVAFGEFDRMITRVDSSMARRVMKINRVQRREEPKPIELEVNADQIQDILTGDREMTPQPAKNELDKMAAAMQSRINKRELEVARAGSEGKGRTVKKVEKEPGRNDPCPCGSGLKYKKCGMINSPAHRARE
ncbi:SEC-C domain-containing protein [Candidatus Dojkabacteria bacterium]|uniref:Protein translocase subunit SecA n=1 Tax=Candidatus Dojkabacteria bacterium TaxID=2099670 RepID=A0A955KYN9_9BACT|nr:SEC-C domain-containing protein [Candidatus Dojkabacteria bacterium]